MVSLIKKITRPIMKPLYKIGDFVKKIGNLIPRIFKGLVRGFKDIGLLIAYVGEFFITYIMCGVKFLINLPQCFIYYAIVTFGYIVYLPISIMLWISWMFGANLYKIEKTIWNYIYDFDSYLYGYLGFNLTKWPKNVRDKCYNCKRLKTSTLKRKAKEINDDFTKILR
jgi:hypothetical protein